ncbi:sulfatase-like hydrolase/transferase [Dehalococcoidales bacterium]|nr:sulfatase-like hydrolase/transferase [Dehalococcoidales bacterium]
MNVILITIDALRVDHLNCYGYQGITTSLQIDKLASKGIMFLQAISNGGGTPEAFPSILASISPPRDHTHYKRIVKGKLTIAEFLKEKGYKTAAVHSNPYLSSFFHYDKGFDVFDEGTGIRVSLQRSQLNRFWSKPINSLLKMWGKFVNLPMPASPPIVRAKQTTGKAISWLKQSKGPFFLWLHYMDTHHPYTPPSKYVKTVSHIAINQWERLNLLYKTSRSPERISEDEQLKLKALYNACIKYIDDAIGILLQEVSLDETLVIITADHGECLGEHGRYGHGLLYEEVIRVPLIIAGGSIKESIKFERMVSLMDIAPTILDILRLKKVDSFEGESLLSLINSGRGRPFVISSALNYPKNISSFSYRTEKWKYILTFERNRIIGRELYDLENDPQEKVNLYEKEAHKATQFENALLKFIYTDIRITEEERIRRKINDIKRFKEV